MKLYTIYISLGSNEGDKFKNLQDAIIHINKKIGNVVNITPIYETKSWGFDGNDFYNTCIEVSTYISLNEIIPTILNIEKELGRERENNSTEYSNRLIDIDVLLIDDEIINHNNLIVPHPRMLDRNFVLFPLKDIAKDIIHPITKKDIEYCLQQCNDNCNINKIDKQLTKPLSFTDKCNYIAIEGNIGAGKTSLSTMLSENFNTKLVLERFADNPFLPKFYENKERFAFPLEMSFLADRHNQLSDDLAQFDLFKNCIISDYYIFKSLIFSQVTLQEEEYKLYRKVFDIMYKEITKPDLYVYLYQNNERLLGNIKKRGRDYEQNIKSDYLQKIHNGYSNFIKTQQNLNVLIIDVSNLDFVNNHNDYLSIIDKINNHLQ